MITGGERTKTSLDDSLESIDGIFGESPTSSHNNITNSRRGLTPPQSEDKSDQSRNSNSNSNSNSNTTPIVAPDSPLVSSSKARVRTSSGSSNGSMNSFFNNHSQSQSQSLLQSAQQDSDRFSKDLFNLSFHDRNAIQEEIHGVSCLAPDESPQFLGAALRSLQMELGNIPSKRAYDQAQELQRSNPGVVVYVNTDDFRLRFLRAELFDTKKAALRMAKYLDLVADVYGKRALLRPIRLSDFSREEMSFLRGGDYQILPYRDRSGRRILCIVTNNRDDISAQVRLKVLIYLWVVAAEDVESQRKGLVVISYSGPAITVEEDMETKHTKQSKFHSSRVTTHAVVGSVVPMRVCAIHFCLPNRPIFHVVQKIYGLALGAWSSRVRFHLGESVELRYQLQSYGVPVELIPSTDTGNVKHVNLKQWIKLREFLEKPGGNINSSSSSTNGAGRGHVSSDSEDAMDYEYTCATATTTCNTATTTTNGMPYSNGGTNNFPNVVSPSIYATNQQQQQQLYFQQQQQQNHQYPTLLVFQQQQQQQPKQQLFHQQKYPHIVECPGSTDVIFRRGKSMTYHPGNAMFQSLIEARLEEHTTANQAGKLAIVLELIQYIRDAKGGRFLTWDAKHNWWLDMRAGNHSLSSNSHCSTTSPQEMEIQSKVNYAFRDFKKKMKTQQNLQVSRSSTFAFERQDGHERKRIKASRNGEGGCGAACAAWGGCGDDHVVSDGD